MARRHWIALLFLFLIKASSYAGPFYCSDLEAVFADSSLCGSLCSSCEEMNPSSSASSGTCDTSRYRGFVYYNNKTYALTTNKGFWEDFSNLAVISDEGINSLLSSILSFYSAGSAWIGLYDPNRTQNFGVVNPDRFVWRSGSVVAYTNWKQGEPNNYVDQADIGVVPVLGEHWVEMDEGGLWNDTGYHASNGGDFTPKRYALVEWNGALDCVNGEPINADTSDYQQAIVDNVCGGDTPCYICAKEEGDNIQECDAGIDENNQILYSCPIDRAVCTATYENPVCPTGGVFNAETGKCEAQPL